MIKFDIIICCYNSQERIGLVLDSLTQEDEYYAYINKLICVDNNSRDSTFEVLNNYTNKIKNMEVFFEKMQGLSYARKKGIDNSVSNWVIFIDDDNLISKDWFRFASNYIERNLSLGAFNGSVVPKIYSDLTEKEKIHLSLSFKALACTHLRSDQINLLDSRHPNGEPFGAGLVIRGDELRKLSENGWLKSTGRLGNMIISGEDGEMIDFIKKKYNTGYCPEMLIHHIIGKDRLSLEYLEKLYKSFYSYYRLKLAKHPFIFLKMYLRTKIYKLKYYVLSKNNKITYSKLVETKLRSLF
jgi:glycosyltransferase involved in cell wall biosynthesis